MIENHNIPLNYIKKENLTGSYQGMRFMFTKQDDKLVVYRWPEPYCFEKTDEEKKKSKEFELTEEGKVSAIAWLNEEYESSIKVWQSVPNY